MICVITGGTRGIGLAVVDRFLEGGARGIFTCSKSMELDGLVDVCRKRDYQLVVDHDDVNSLGDRFVVVRNVDMVLKLSVEDWLYCIDKLTSRVDVLINNAGVWSGDDEDLVTINLLAVNLIMKWYGDKLMNEFKNGDEKFVPGRVINVASVSAHRACVDSPLYGASKAGVVSLTKTYAIKYSKFMRAVSVSPGWVNTKFVNEGHIEETCFGLDDAIKGIPVNCQAEPKEVAELIYRIKDLDYLTGVDIIFDGGVCAKEF